MLECALPIDHTDVSLSIIDKANVPFSTWVLINRVGKIPNPEMSSANILADCGVDITNLKRLGGWKSITVAEGYLDDYLENKHKCENKNLGVETQVVPKLTSASTSNATSMNKDVLKSSSTSTIEISSNDHQSVNLTSTLNIHNAANCKYGIYLLRNDIVYERK
ncbi:hypothetical protein NQ317_002343 [Molorchus minor]|uniref:Tyr recombinase domain-containing protein n=1 Tax=Molorchus minor TaxID=1323400 RepID=A0ABQ9ISS9_9CUCU|nr:hypothetical protein NQ317_002343 [Molorchus minor]